MELVMHSRCSIRALVALGALAHAASIGGCQTGGGQPGESAASASNAAPSSSTTSTAPRLSVTAPSASRATAPAAHVLTADIQAGIEKHIADTALRNGGYFPLMYEGKEMRLKLVRVHTEYLANLGPGRHFACVDLANIDGNVYDVDFFLAGDPGSMTVTETTVHKLNGIPYYLWEQRDDDTWVREPVVGAPEALMGVVREQDAFEFLYEATLPTLTGSARAWLPIASSDRFQTVEVKEISAPGRRGPRTLTDNHGNRVLMLELGPEHSGKPISMRFQVQRREASAYSEPESQPETNLNPERLVPDAPAFRRLAIEVTEGKSGDLVRARAIFDHTVETFKYQRYGTGWGKGDAVRACDAKSGNCTDFHAYFIALARAAGIPARFAIGASIPSERDEGGIDGYHCWAEFHAEDKWWPVDLSEANKYSPLSTYYFGHQPANRLELSRGRDLVFGSGADPASGPINFLAYPVLEVEGEPVAMLTRFSFHRTARTTSGAGNPATSGASE